MVADAGWSRDGAGTLDAWLSLPRIGPQRLVFAGGPRLPKMAARLRDAARTQCLQVENCSSRVVR